MADVKSNVELERIYTIPLRREWIKEPQYKRSGRAIKAIKKFIARHMRVDERDVEKVKLDVYLNNELWFKGRRKPPAKIKVIAKKEGGIVKVELAEIPEYVKFLKARNEKSLKKAEAAEKMDEKKEGIEERIKETQEIKKEEKTEEEKKIEIEKEKAVEQAQIKAAEQQAKVQKHAKRSKQPQIHRMALKK